MGWFKGVCFRPLYNLMDAAYDAPIIPARTTILDCARSRFAYLRLSGFREAPGAALETLTQCFETYDAFLVARCEAEGFLVNTMDAEAAAETVKRIRFAASNLFSWSTRQGLWPPISPTVRYGPSTRPSRRSRTSVGIPGPWASFRRIIELRTDARRVRCCCGICPYGRERS